MTALCVAVTLVKQIDATTEACVCRYKAQRQIFDSNVQWRSLYFIASTGGAVGSVMLENRCFLLLWAFNTEPQIPKFTCLQVLVNIPEVIPTHLLLYQVCTGSRLVQEAHYPECFADMFGVDGRGKDKIICFSYVNVVT